MKTNPFFILTWVMVVAFSSLGAQAFQPLSTKALPALMMGAESAYTSPAKIISFVGDVTIILADGTTGPAKVGEIIPVGGKIITGASGQIALTFMTGITAVVGPNSKATIIKSDYNQAEGKREVVIYLDQGQVIPNVIKQNGQTDVTIITPNSDKYTTSEGIASVSYSNNSFSIQVAQGDGVYTSPTGESVPIYSGSQISALTTDGATTVSQVTQVDPQTIQTIDSIVQVAILSSDLITQGNQSEVDGSGNAGPFNIESSSANPANIGGAGSTSPVSNNQ